MYVEAFTQAKDPARPRSNEDRWVGYESRLFAVIDGVTDKSGLPLPDGSTRGQVAGRVIEACLRRMIAGGELPTTSEIVASLTDELAAANRDLGLTDAEAATAPNLRCAAQLVAASKTEAGWRFIAIGDCGARIRRRQAAPLLLGASGIHDDVIAIWRSLVVNHVMHGGGSASTALAIGRAYALVGNLKHIEEYTAHVDAVAHSRLAETATTIARAEHPTAAAEHIDIILNAGILGLGKYRNSSGPLGFASLDGSEVPLSHVQDLTLTAAEVTAIELFSDGYFKPPASGAPSVRAWERHFKHVEATDPYKIGPYRSTKGSSVNKFTDDRTVVIVRQELGE